ncbi:MAG: hypothetical protein ACUZ8I_10415 [Candidatus Scalindua sp.]
MATLKQIWYICVRKSSYTEVFPRDDGKFIVKDSSLNDGGEFVMDPSDFTGQYKILMTKDELESPGKKTLLEKKLKADIVGLENTLKELIESESVDLKNANEKIDILDKDLAGKVDQVDNLMKDAKILENAAVKDGQVVTDLQIKVVDVAKKSGKKDLEIDKANKEIAELSEKLKKASKHISDLKKKSTKKKN